MIISIAISVSNYCAMAGVVVSRQQLVVSFVPFFPLSPSSFYILENLSLQNSQKWILGVWVWVSKEGFWECQVKSML